MKLTSQYVNKKTSNAQMWLLWSAAYMAMVFLFTWLGVGMNMGVVVLYFAMACPFIFKPELYFCICFSFSLITYYFCGADEGIYSIYTILMIICMLKSLFIRKRIRVCYKLFAAGTLLSVLAVVSYTHSKYYYIKGLFALLYVIVVAIVVSACLKPEDGELEFFWPSISAIFFLLCVVSCLISGGGELGRFSIHPAVNYNTFGTALNILSVIFAVKHFILDDKRKKSFLVLWILALLLILLSGSRSALLGALGAYLFVQIIYNRQKGKTVRFLLSLLIIGALVLLVSVPVLNLVGVDMSRFNYQDVIESGGSNRFELWETLIPNIIKHHFGYGIGPGHYCTSKLIYTLLHLNYTHSHNILLEAFCELGIVGLMVYSYLLFVTFNKARRDFKMDKMMYLTFACFTALLINGLGEAYFCNILPWLLTGIIFAYRKGSPRRENHELN